MAQLLVQIWSKPQVVLHFLRPFSSTSTRRPKWNSTTNVIITNPTLLIMESCTTMLQLKQIQARMTVNGLITHTFPVSRVVAFCALADIGDVDYAHELFSQIENPNTYIWNTMIRGYGKAKIPTVGFWFFRRMVRERVEMDRRSFVFALKVCEQFCAISGGESVHCRICKMGFSSDLIVQNGLVHFYAERGCLDFARKMFDETLVKDVVSWTSIIDGHVVHNCSDEALELFNLMLLSDVEPNEVTMIPVLSACSLKGELSMGKSIHEYIQKKKISWSPNLQNAMLDMYVKCGSLVTAREIFDNMKNKDVFSWTSMVNGYAKFGKLELARKLFDDMPVRNVISWNAMVAGYSQNNQPKEALKLFLDMVEAGLAATENTLVCVLSACGQLGSLDLGQWIHHYYIHQKRIQFSLILENAFVDMYAKCGSLHAAATIFNEMVERDLVSWNSMVAGYASHGHAKKALVLFEQMTQLGFRPDDITFVGVLSACSHGGLVSEGQNYFKSMKRNFGIEPKVEHYACMIDLYGRIGLLEEAYKFIAKMPMGASVAAWGALLNACRMHGNVELAKVSAYKLLELDPEDSGIYSLLANILAHERRWGDVRMVRCMMREKGVKKTPGRSLIEIEVRKQAMYSLKDIVPAAENNINTQVIVLNIGKTASEGQNKTCLALVADETAAVHFQLWGNECDAFEPGDIIQLTNGIFSCNRRSWVLRAGKRGKVEKVGEFTMAYVETPNMSEIEWVHDPSKSKFVQKAVISPHSRIFPPLP
ncbi:pentatricopeptide repeat-containing protein At2g22410, mitochondrial-like isoform X2 [Juglans microcarpa x Juglans regia]|uniref:pentatricopeptide repeat-containing protein At2g22410, mitochondrial-like isoform X2 n=1 Tax=Juglans microcarpa x Juglans regia TaxID=2249226 RepID=UPI001B7E1BD0|nr:pentatricopeptide repeat-containing protein At2g22410, mitochondrial-like isoform X2 [Juglans microcarpa x Juglans regia]